ncbi:MAG: hypothetical protein CMO74_11580 [Verrucomicrobiales bacterium]|nr:hypothetical protein [Verrucomicrobiales bacterium]MBL69072.1 hypothetical protein [Verrucomicrobiales bacterium]
MNKTLLLILLDFLLLHMIHDSPWNKVEQENAHLSGGTETYAKHAQELQLVTLQLKQAQVRATEQEAMLNFSRKSAADQARGFAELTEEKENLKSQLENAKNAHSETEKARRQGIADAAAQAILLKDTIAAKERVINLKNQTISEAEKQAATRDQAISVLTDQVNTLEGQIGDLKNDFSTKITNLDNTNKGLVRKNGILTAENTNLKDNLKDVEDNLKDVEDDLMAEKTKAKNDRDAAANKITGLEKEITGLEKDKDTQTNRANQLEKDKGRLVNERDKALEAKTTAETQVKALKVKVGEEQKRTEAARTEAQKQQTRAVTAEKQAVEYLAQAKAVAVERDTVKEINDRLQTDIKKVAENTDATTKATLKEVIAQSKRIPQSPNKLFNEYLANRVPVQMQLSRSKPGIVYVNGQPRQAPRQVNKTPQPIFVQGQRYLYAIMHTDQSPFSLQPQGSTAWEKAVGIFRRNGKSIPVHWLGFLKNDPRVLVAPLHKDSAKKEFLNIGKTYPLAKRPQDYSKAIIVHNGEEYGEVDFKVDPKLGNYVLMDKPFMGGLFSKRMNPKKGDVVISRTGELLGIMVNDKYCAVIRENELDKANESFAAFVVLNDDAQVKGLNSTLKKLAGLIKAKPSVLQ